MPQLPAPEKQEQPFLEPFTEYEINQHELSLWADDGGSTRYEFNEYGNPDEEISEA